VRGRIAISFKNTVLDAWPFMGAGSETKGLRRSGLVLIGRQEQVIEPKANSWLSLLVND
jgi:hypothetical protein